MQALNDAAPAPEEALELELALASLLALGSLLALASPLALLLALAPLLALGATRDGQGERADERRRDQCGLLHVLPPRQDRVLALTTPPYVRAGHPGHSNRRA